MKELINILTHFYVFKQSLNSRLWIVVFFFALTSLLEINL